MKSLKVDSGKCCGCRICELSCSMNHLGIFNPLKALLRISIDRQPQTPVQASNIDVPEVCLQCDPAPCSEACPEEAIVKAPSEAWVVDEEKCTGCGLCVEACSYGMIWVEEDGTCARKCDLCGGEPSCVALCPTQALTFS